MFYDGGTFMGGMHWFLWIFLGVVLVGVIVFYGWGRQSEQRRRTGETPHEVLQRRMASGSPPRSTRSARGCSNATPAQQRPELGAQPRLTSLLTMSESILNPGGGVRSADPG